MELKVWVDGIQRVVCGATFDTTCQDVVIALAHAMGRTGRFSLIEKWRDNERPLTPAECPLRVLQKWGEYAAEVRFVLCQAETSQTRQSQDRLAKLSSSMNSDKASSRDKVLFPHSSVVGSTVHTGDASVKRSLTFSGAHNQAADDSSWLSSSAPTSKLRRTNLGPVPNGDVRRPMAPPPHSNVPLSNTQRQVRDQRTMPMTQPSVPVQHQSSSSNQQPHPEQRTMPAAQSSSQPPPSSSSNQQQPQPHPVPSPRHRAAQSPRRQVDEQNNSAFSGPGGRGLRPNSVMPPASGSQQGPDHPPPRAASLPSNQGPPHLIHRPQPQHHPSAQPRNTSATSVQPSPRLGDQTRQVSPGTTPVQQGQGQNQRLQPSPSHQPSQPQSQQPFQPSLAQSQQPSLPQSQRLQPSPSHQPQPHPHPSSQTIQPQQTQPRSSQQLPTNNSQLRPPQTTPNLPGPTQHKNSSSPEPPPLPSSPPPSLPSNTKAPLMDHHKTLAAIKDSILASDHSRGASLEIEEYDLDRNFPDSHQSSSSSRGGSSRNPPPSMGLEYRLDGSGVVGSSGPGSGGLQLEGEHAKLLRLVNMQQERLKTQESQLSLVNTEISALEEKDSDYEEKLHVIMEELLLQETRQRDFETEVSDLERVEWANVLHGEQQRELDLNLNIATYKAKLIENVDKLEDIKAKEDELLAELKQEEKKMEEERERLKAEEAKSREEEARNRQNISKLQAEFLELRKKGSECESMMVKVDQEIDSTEKDFAEKEKEVNDLEVSLKDENLKDFATHPVPREEITSSGETIIRILEGRMSPRPAPTTTTTANPPTSPTKVAQPNNTRTPTAAPPVISALATKNQSGVWV